VRACLHAIPNAPAYKVTTRTTAYIGERNRLGGTLRVDVYFAQALTPAQQGIAATALSNLLGVVDYGVDRSGYIAHAYLRGEG
jgi:hypothetical protein